MLPIYLFGNLHCLGMCGPLVMMIGQHRYRWLYFLGRTFSFSLAGAIAGAAGAVVDAVFREFHLAAGISILFGAVLLLLGVYTLMGWSYPGYHWVGKRLARTNQHLSILLLRDQPWPTFLFGFFTLALPCGQTLIVFSACALSGDMWVGMLNGCAFALLTSPSLFLAMQATSVLRQARQYYQKVMGWSAIVVGVIAILRGCAEMDWIPHLILNPQSAAHYHIVIF